MGGRTQRPGLSTFQQYISWCQEKGKVSPLPISYWSIGGYLVYFVDQTNGSCRSLNNKLSHIRTTCTLSGYKWLSEQDQFKLKDPIKNLKYHDYSKSRTKDALTIILIMRIISILDIRILTNLLLVICYLLGHNGLLRGGELTSGFKVKNFIWDDDFLGFKLCLLRTKTYRTGEATFVHYRDNNSPYSLVKLLTK